jgi:hypothetical protein
MIGLDDKVRELLLDLPVRPFGNDKEKGRTSARDAAFLEHNRPQEEIIGARIRQRIL